MASVDNRVVEMEFDNKSFSSAVSTTIGLLDKLKASLSFNATKNGIDDVQTSANKFSLAGVGSAIDGASQKFSALSIVGVTALATIVNKAVDAGINITKAFTISPITDGFSQYQQQINATQTILANTSQTGGTLKTVTDTLNTLNDYANKTIFNFSDMATNLGTFTSAGIKLGPASDAIQGLSNVAAAAGAGTQQAAGAMYQLSQALGRGKLQAQDWNSVVAAGMASSNFKNALLETAKAMGTIKMPKTESIDDWVKAGGSFQDAMADGNITSGVLIQTLQAMTGNMTDAQLAAEGYSAAQIKTIQQMAKEAESAATNVKTAKQLMDNLSQGVGSAWAQVFKTIVGDLPTATKLFTGLSVALNHIFVDPVNDLNDLLAEFVKLGGMDKVIQGVTNVFHALASVINPIKDAFKEIFPPKTAQDLLYYATVFEIFTKRLIAGSATADKIKRTFAGLFAIFDLAKQVVGGILFVFSRLFGQLGSGVPGILDFTAHMGDLLVAFDKMVTNGSYIQKFFGDISTYVTKFVDLLVAARDAVFHVFDNFKAKDGDAISSTFGAIGDKLANASGFFDKIKAALSEFGSKISPLLQSLGKDFAAFGKALGDALNSQALGNLLKGGEVAALFAMVAALKNFLGGGFHVDVGQGIFGKVQETLDGLKGSLKAMQAELKAKALLEIAIALGVLAVSVLLLANIPGPKIQTALAALAGGLAELLGAMAVLTKVTGPTNVLKLPVIAAALVILAGALLILAASVAILGSLKYDVLKQGLAAVGLLLGGLVVAALLLSKNSGGLVAAGIGIAAIAVAMNILAGAVFLFGQMDLVTLAKGIGAVIVALVGIALAMKLMPNGASMVLQAAGLLILSVALEAIVGVVKTFSLLSYEQIAKGLGSIAVALLVIAGAMRLMPNGPNLLLQAAGLLLISVALAAITGVVAALAQLSYEALAKGLGSLVVILASLVIAMKNMESAVRGAATLAIVAAALTGLVVAIELLAHTSWEGLIKGIGALAVVLAVLIVAGYAAEGASLGLFAIAAAALALGGAVALVGIGIGALAAGLGVLVGLGGKGIAVLVQVIAGVISQIPNLATAFAIGLVNVLKVIGANGPAIVKAFSTIIGSLLDAVTQNIPKLVALIEALVAGIVAILVKDVPLIVSAAITLIEGLLTGITQAIPTLIAKIAELIITLINALAAHAPDIIQAGVNLIVTLLQGIANAIPQIVGAVANIITTFISAIASAEGQIIAAGASAIIYLITGLGQNAGRIVSAGADALINFINGLGSNSAKIVNAAGNAILTFLIALDDAINTYEPQIIRECVKIGEDIVTGIVKGLSGLGGAVLDKIKSGVSGAVSGGVSYVTGLIGSPYKIGSLLSGGITKGVEDGSPALSKSMQNSVGQAISDVAKKLGQADLPNLELNPTITPILDLSNVQAGASKLTDMITPAPINLDASFGQASAISVAQQQTQAEAASSTPVTPVSSEIKFEQNNYSPTALSPVEIYRNTRTQLSMAKEALTK